MHWYFISTSSPQIGFGHVSRLRLLATETAAMFPAHGRTFMLQSSPDAGDEPPTLHELSEVRGPAIAIVDGPDSFIDMVTATASLQAESVLVAAFRMYGVDEPRATHEAVSLVPSFMPTRLYRRRSGDQFVYSGRRLILVRRTLFASGLDLKVDPPLVVVSMGSADPSDLTSLAAEALEGLNERFQIVLVVGALNPQGNQIRERYADLFDVVNQQDINFDELLKSASFAVVSGGLTRYECIAARTPFVSISLNREQAKYTLAVTEAGFGIHAGVRGEVTPSQIRQSLVRLADDIEGVERMRQGAEGMLSADNAVELANFLVAAADGIWATR